MGNPRCLRVTTVFRDLWRESIPYMIEKIDRFRLSFDMVAPSSSCEEIDDLLLSDGGHQERV